MAGLFDRVTFAIYAKDDLDINYKVFKECFNKEDIGMIEYLGHQLICYNSKLPNNYISYKCLKCNNIINYTVSDSSILKGLYWMYDNGGDSYGSNETWHFIELTCEEECIKAILE